MKKFAIIENGLVVNITVSDNPLAENWVEIPPTETTGIGWKYDGKSFNPAQRLESMSVVDAVATRVSIIKQEAATRISALDWKIDRAKEQIALDLADVSALTAVYRERQAIRDASGAAEAAVAAMTDVAAVEGFVW